MSERVLLPEGVTPTHYSLDLRPRLEQLEYYCDERITVTVSKAGLTEVSMHFKEIYVESASFASAAGVSCKCVEISYNTTSNVLKLGFDAALPEGEGTISLKFRGILNGDMCGFYKSEYVDANGKKKVMASTQFEALDARRAFPCWDEPGVKATFTVSVLLPAHLTALSNMPEVSSTHVSSKEGGGKEGDGSLWKRVVFDKSPKMSTYLLAWAIGEFDFVQAATKGGVAIRVYSPPGRGPQGQFALDVAVRSLDFYDDFFKTPYPLPKLDMICITEFAMGAMENWGLVTYRETALMVDEATASPQQKQRVAIVVAHELAHQWFGNLVTMAWWDGLWLNEGFAAFMEHFCIDALFPEYKMWEQYTTDGFSAALRLDALKSSHPVIVPIRHAEEVEQVFDAISYCKGSAVVNMVSAFLGPQQFQAGLQAYMARHAYGNTETGDLWAAWSQASGMDVASLMRTWTTVMGYPYLKVVSEKWREGEVEVTLEQGRFLSDGSAEEGGEGGGALWSIPLLFSTAGTVSQEAVLMDQKQQTFIVPVAASAAGALPWLKINAGQKALVRVAHSTEMVARLQGSIAEVAPVDRAALLLDAYALAKAGLAPLESVVTILRALAGDEESIVWSAIAGVLGGLHMLMEQVSAEGSSSATFQQFEAFGKHIVVQALAKVGWESVSGESHTHKLMRASVMGLLDSFAWSDPLVAAEAKSRFDRHWEDPQALPAEYKTAVYRIVLMNGGLAEYESVLAEFNGTEDNQVRKYPMFTLGATQDQALKMRTLEWAVKSGAVKLQDTFYPIGSVAGDLRGAHMAWKYFQENFDCLKEMYCKASPSLMDAVVINSISRFASFAKADEIEAFFATHPLPSSVRRIGQSLENMRTNAGMLRAISQSDLAQPAFWTI